VLGHHPALHDSAGRRSRERKGREWASRRRLVAPASGRPSALTPSPPTTRSAARRDLRTRRDRTVRPEILGGLSTETHGEVRDGERGAIAGRNNHGDQRCRAVDIMLVLLIIFMLTASRRGGRRAEVRRCTRAAQSTTSPPTTIAARYRDGSVCLPTKTGASRRASNAGSVTEAVAKDPKSRMIHRRRQGGLKWPRSMGAGRGEINGGGAGVRRDQIRIRPGLVPPTTKLTGIQNKKL